MHYGKTAQPGGAQGMVAADAGLRLALGLAKHLGIAYLGTLGFNNKYKGTLLRELASWMKPGPNLPHARTLDFFETLLTLLQTVLASQSPHFLLGSAGLHLMTPDPRPEKGGIVPWAELAAKAGTSGFDAALDLALDETRRYEPPLTLVERYAKGTQTICGVTVPDGCAVFAMVASANRDSAKYGAQAEEFHFDRVLTTDHPLARPRHPPLRWPGTAGPARACRAGGPHRGHARAAPEQAAGPAGLAGYDLLPRAAGPVRHALSTLTCHERQPQPHGHPEIQGLRDPHGASPGPHQRRTGPPRSPRLRSADAAGRAARARRGQGGDLRGRLARASRRRQQLDGADLGAAAHAGA